MKSVGGAGLVIVGFLFLYLAITGRIDCFFAFVSCITGGAVGTPATTQNGGAGNTKPGCSPWSLDPSCWFGSVDWGSVFGGGGDSGGTSGSGATTASPGFTIAAPSPVALPFH